MGENMANNIRKKTLFVTKLGVLAALSMVLAFLFHFPIIPAVSFLEYDPADIPIMLGTFALGPWAGLILTVIVSVIQGCTVSAASSWYGIVMHIIATGTYVLFAGLTYKHDKTKRGAILSLIFGVAAWVAVMIPANLFLTPVYLEVIVGLPAEAAKATVKSLLVPILIFNLIKSVLNSAVTFFTYKPLSGILHKQ